MKAYLRPINFFYTATFVITSLISGQNSTQASTYTPSEVRKSLSNNKSNHQSNSNQEKKPRLEPPDTGTPIGKSTPTGSRPQAMCKKTDKPLTAINVNNGKDFTTSEFPTFWFYIPYTRQEIKSLEFVLNNKRETKTIYETSVQLLDQPGIIKITIPSKQEYSININKTYRWYLNLKCEPNAENEPDKVISGWVKRERVNSEEEIWHDYINNLAELHFSNPGNPKFNRDWNKLLKAIGKEWIIQENFVNSEQIRLKE